MLQVLAAFILGCWPSCMQVVIRRERLCIGVKAGRQGELPKGSLTLDRSSTGATLYMEPEPAVGLNNAEARLTGQEADEEDSILSHLSSLIADDSDTLQQVSPQLLFGCNIVNEA